MPGVAAQVHLGLTVAKGLHGIVVGVAPVQAEDLSKALWGRVVFRGFEHAGMNHLTAAPARPGQFRPGRCLLFAMGWGLWGGRWSRVLATMYLFGGIWPSHR